jgi:hypothetical protein
MAILKIDTRAGVGTKIAWPRRANGPSQIHSLDYLQRLQCHRCLMDDELKVVLTFLLIAFIAVVIIALVKVINPTWML